MVYKYSNDRSITNLRSIIIAATVLFIVLYVDTVYAGSIRGTVRAKETNEPIVGANVSLPGTGMGAVTNASGEFFVSMFAGTYKIRVSMLGYERYDNKNVVVPDDTAEVVLEIPQRYRTQHHAKKPAVGVIEAPREIDDPGSVATISHRFAHDGLQVRVGLQRLIIIAVREVDLGHRPVA